ncbi:hypothetical protein FRC16_001016 [Serendipita sp. 398]|nr:hypothetical protein FRC16_001016 [Serendipita sp. 398]
MHRDPHELGMDARACNQRRRLFLELRLFDATESIQYGRPLTMNGRYVSRGAIVEDDLDEGMGTRIHQITKTNDDRRSHQLQTGSCDRNGGHYRPDDIPGLLFKLLYSTKA